MSGGVLLNALSCWSLEEMNKACRLQRLSANAALAAATTGATVQENKKHLPVQEVALQAEQHAVLRVTLAQSNNPQCDEPR